jgi:valyl-tRNA synthetase
LVQIDGVIDKPDNANNDHWIAAKSMEDAREKAAKKWNVDPSKINLTQDQDVLDTWFSSGLLPLTCFGWPNVGEEFKSFFPTDLLETGHDIIFFWVARMVFMSYFFMDCLPFHTVYLHPIVRDAQGRKMSKSLGNVIDPLEVIDGISLENLIKKLYEGNLPENELKKSAEEREKIFPSGIPECGADALRLGLMSYLVQGRNINLDVSRVVSYRFFGNKLWNATKFFHYYTKDEFTYKPIEKKDKLSFIDKWILNKLARVTQTFNKSFENYSFGDATMAIYSYWQDHICDVYIEAVKPVLANGENKNLSKNVLLHCIDAGLKILHPLMPFITEELYQRLPKEDKESITIADFPVDITWLDDNVESLCEKILDITHKILSILTQFNLKVKPNIAIFTEDDILRETLKEETLLIATLSRCASVTILDKREKEGWLLNVINANTDVYLDIKSHIDLKKEIERLQNALKEKVKYLDDIDTRINKAGYEERVPEDVKQQNNEKIQKTKIEITKLEDSIKSLEALNK